MNGVRMNSTSIFEPGRWAGLLRPLFLLSIAVWLTGCSTASMQPGDLSLVRTDSDKPRAGNVYLLRGFIGIWSTGIDQLGVKINESGIRATVYRNEQWRELTEAILARYKDQKDFEPLIIIGHSWGADHALEMAQQLGEANIPVDLIITLDPVTPPPVPGNIKWCYNIYQPHGAWDAIPFFRGVPLKQDEAGRCKLENVNIRGERTDLLEPDTDHYNIEKNVKIHAEVLKQLAKICPSREQWVRSHPLAKVSQVAAHPADERISTSPPSSEQRSISTAGAVKATQGDHR